MSAEVTESKASHAIVHSARKMRNVRFNINLYIIIPVIFAGLAALSYLAAYQLARYHIEGPVVFMGPIIFWGIALVCVTFLLGWVTVKFIIDPVKRFVDRTQNLGVIGTAPVPQKTSPDSEMHQFTRVFDQVTEILSKVEARELFPEVVGQSRSIRAVLRRILKVAPSDTTVLLSGETGTGKELLASCIHRHSQRRDRPFIAINCAAIPAGLLESELFGHEKGAFTGAQNRKPGKFELADGGTLFLDEIGDMPLEIQSKILRALEERRIERLGGLHPINVDVRFIAATNTSLLDQVQQGLFRKDLYYRLNGFPIYLPPLRKRREDIPLLAEHFLAQAAPDKSKRLTSESLQTLIAHDWPGNIRELQNTVQSAALMAESAIESIHFGPIIGSVLIPPTDVADSTVNLSLDEKLELYEKSMLIDALNHAKGVQKIAARTLRIKERSLWHRLKKYGIEASGFKDR
jgi:transcriptional regulator with GAF, ATPase, and Fis domain